MSDTEELATERVAPTGGEVLRRVVAPAMVGRDAELELLAETLSDPPALAVIEGEAGIGKTRMVGELAKHPAITDRRYLVGGCRRIQEPFPLGPVIEALRGLGEELGATRLSPVAGALRPLLPELAAWLPLAPEPLEDRAAERHRVFRALTEVVDAVSPVVLVLEDLHWADEHTLEFLPYLLGEAPAGLSVVITVRGDETDPGVRGALAKLPAAVHRAQVVLGPLDVERTTSLAVSILDTDRLSREFAEHLWTRSSGVPLAIEELLALLRARGTLIRRAGRWERKKLEVLDVPSGIRDPVLERLGRLPNPARTVVQAAAVLQEPTPVGLLAAVCQAPDPDVVCGIEDALSSGLLTDHGLTIGFRHVLAAQTVYEAIAGPRRTELHRGAATALKRLDPVPLGQLAHHLKHAGRLQEWMAVAERAADQAIELGHDAQAVRLLEDVLRHAHLDIEQRGRLAVKLGCAMYETLQPAHELIDLLRGALASNLPPVVRGELRYWLAVALEHAGSDPTELRQLEMEAVNDLDERPDLKARVMLDLGIPMAPGIPLPEHKMWLRRALDALPDVSDPAFAVFVRGKSAMALVTAGDPAWRELVDRLIDDTNGAPRRRLEVHAYLSVGAVASYVGHYRTCARLLESSLAAAQAMQSRRLELHIRSAGVVLDYCRGSWTGLDDTLQQLLDELADYAPARVDLEAVAGCLALAHGRLDEARSRLTAARSGAHDMASLDMEAFIVQALGRLAVVSGDVQSEVAELDRLLAAIESKQYWAPLVRALPVATQLLSAAGQKSRVRDLVRQVAREWKHLDIPLATAALRHAKGYLAEAAQQWPGAAQHFQAAVDRYRRLECPYEETQAREQAAAALLRAGNARGEETLRAALAGYRQLGASWDEARCTRVARGFGIRIPVPHRGGRKGYGDQLSPREKEVVRLAAVGCSNKQIADELFLSPATVGSHLARAMSKLGVHSRVALATHIPDALKTHAFAATQQPRGRSG